MVTQVPVMADYSYPPTEDSIEAAKRDLIAFRLANGFNPDPQAPAILMPALVVLMMDEEVKRAARES